MQARIVLTQGLNDRRKKIRCPGERPRCSACTRLRQQCSFSDPEYISEQSASRIESRMSSRLEQLEDKLDSLISRVVPPSIEDSTSSSGSGRNNGTMSYPSTARLPSPPSSAFLPVEVVTRAIEFYFQHIHRQPLWLFERHSISHSDACEDLLDIILALSITYNPGGFSDDNLKSPVFYSKAARRDVMLKIAEGRMSIRSTQTLCLLSYFSFISGDVAMAGFDIALAKNMTQLLATGNQTSQEMSKLLWSIQYLSLTCGAPALVPFISDDINTPYFLSMDARDARDPLAACLPAPRATEYSLTGAFADIWSHSLKICNLWTDIRLYVAKCIEGVARCPWQPDSDYTKLCSQLLEVEMLWPNALSYNSVGFSSVPPQHVRTDRLNWLPWLRGQVTYHAFHCILNHPFLYTVKAKTPSHRLGANTFWRSSYEKALRHSTWVSRLIRAATEKGLQLSDPFFAQAAAIASTLLLYWSRSSDSRVQASSLENLEICRKLVTEMAECWPDLALNQFIEFIDPPTHADERISSTAAKTSLIWTLLDVAASQFPNYSDQSLRGREAWNGRSGTDGDLEIPRSEMSSPPTDMRESTAHYASPPAWMQAETDPGSGSGPTEQWDDAESLAHHVATSDRTLAHDLAWGPWENLGPIGENFCLNMDWWDINQF
ncbi:hypothetical protein FSARC_9838 [Fusarium sarcochroum]|uniref:Zn(2)-C6 fungal-type domain-containing protein n=1 Tax=Fusarium sarcochroum TaxID=1208366 RepID=A0A8H4TQ91_9HYPO|nr:hypothetical protein FSARC_9838 [Fusarium sarcochroum]